MDSRTLNNIKKTFPDFTLPILVNLFAYYSNSNK